MVLKNTCYPPLLLSTSNTAMAYVVLTAIYGRLIDQQRLLDSSACGTTEPSYSLAHRLAHRPAEIPATVGTCGFDEVP